MKQHRLIPYALSFAFLLLGACQRESSNISSAETPAPPAIETPSTPPLSGPGEPTVEVSLTDGKIDMPVTLEAGPQNFSVSNNGEREHNFEIEGQNLENEFATPLKPGETRSMLVDLKPGTYKVYCPVEDHEQKGMSLELKVE